MKAKPYIEPPLPPDEIVIGEDGREYLCRWQYQCKLVKVFGIDLVALHEENWEELIPENLYDRVNLTLTHWQYCVIRKMYVFHPVEDEVLSHRLIAAGRRLEYAYEAFERQYQREQGLPEIDVRLPPRFGEILISFITPRKKRDELIGSLAAYHFDMAVEYGDQVAAWLYWKEVGRSIGPVVARSIEWLLKRKYFLQAIGLLLDGGQQHNK